MVVCDQLHELEAFGVDLEVAVAVLGSAEQERVAKAVQIDKCQRTSRKELAVPGEVKA